MTTTSPSLGQPLDEASLRGIFNSAQPFRHIAVDNFLNPAFAKEVVAALPDFDRARELGLEFKAVNERGKVQVTDDALFPEPVRQLNQFMASPELLSAFERITGIDGLLPDSELVGGGLHVMSGGSHLDVHVDFNLIEGRQLHRRLNVLLFLNPGWQSTWGGELELWDADVRKCERRFEPQMNRLILFETSEFSYHGVRKVRSPASIDRRSFAAYYYTSQAPEGWDGLSHSTVFRARPHEIWKRAVLMPGERTLRKTVSLLRRVARRLRAG